jgi:histidinol dehydrogenase
MTTINKWNWVDLDTAARVKIMRRAEEEIDAAADKVRPIIEDVKKRGDEALLEYARKFDKAEIKGGLKASDAEFEAAYKEVDKEVVEAIRFCAENVRIHHQQQMDRVEGQWMDEIRPGLWGGEKITAIDSAGIYVPRGKGAFPSMMYMQCMPAIIAGVKEIAVCSPPTPEGGIDAASLVAADVCGVRNVYKVGGAQAIAALAYGTQTIPKVVKVNGPGSSYVAAAKRLLSHIVDPGMPAGPSDSLVLADGNTDATNTAWDMINESEHGPDSATLLITADAKLAEAVAKVLPTLIDSLPEPRRGYCQTVFSTYGGIILCRDMSEAIDIANQYAAEHLLLKVADPSAVLPLIRNAGEILIGESTPMVMGNFGIGVNAVLPTGGNARTHSATSVWDYLKRTSLAHVTAEGFEILKKPVIALADYEGFPGHAGVLRNRNTGVFTPVNLSKLLKK